FLDVDGYLFPRVSIPPGVERDRAHQLGQELSSLHASLRRQLAEVRGFLVEEGFDEIVRRANERVLLTYRVPCCRERPKLLGQLKAQVLHCRQPGLETFSRAGGFNHSLDTGTEDAYVFQILIAAFCILIVWNAH